MVEKQRAGRSLFAEVSSGLQAMRYHREGRVRLRTHHMESQASAAESVRRTHQRDVRTYQVKVTLMETEPPIWRRLLVPGNTTLRRLDRIIQTAMGWTNSHLHTFTAGGVLYADSHAEWEIDVKDERRVRLESIAKEEGEAFVYEYDMGDSWRHQVLVEEVRWGDSDGPVCLSGERACPPEDCGGVQGYYDTLEILRSPRHDEYEHTKTWIESMTGGPFDPDAFDFNAVNAAINALR